MSTDIIQKRLEKEGPKKQALIYDIQALFVVNNILKQNPNETFIYIK